MAKVKIAGTLPIEVEDKDIELKADTGVKKTIANYFDWKKISKSCEKVKTKVPPTSHPALSAKIRGQILPKFRQIPPDSAKSRIFCQIPHCRVFPTGSMGMQDLVMMGG